jgi:hypothetical protein
MSLWRIHAILAAYSQEEIFEKIQLMGNMGRQELRNVPGLLLYLLQDDSRHVPGRARGKAGAATKRRAGNKQDEERDRKRREIAKTLYVN